MLQLQSTSENQKLKCSREKLDGEKDEDDDEKPSDDDDDDDDDKDEPAIGRDKTRDKPECWGRGADKDFSSSRTNVSWAVRLLP